MRSTIWAGQINARVDGQTFHLGSKDFLYIPESCVHEFEFEPGTEGSVYSFPRTILEAAGPNPNEISNALSRPVHGAVSDQLSVRISLLRDSADRSGPLRAQHLMALAHCVLAQLAEYQVKHSQVSNTSGADRLEKLNALIAENREENWTAARYANALSITTGHLSRICKAATGQSASAYIEDRIMGEACRLLAFTRLPISEVGYRLGYADASYFSKRFRRVRGVPPSDYRSQFTS
jgi:AraC family transcriptional activator of pobA